MGFFVSAIELHKRHVALASFNLWQNCSIPRQHHCADDVEAATAKAIDYFHVDPKDHFRVVVTRLEKAKTRASAE